MEILQSDLYYSTHVPEKMHTKRCLPQEALFSSSVFTADSLIDHLVSMVRTYGTLVTASAVSSFPLSGMHVERDKLQLQLQFTGEGEATIWCRSCLAILGSPPDLHTELICLCVDAQQWEFAETPSPPTPHCHPYDGDVRLLVI